MNAANSVRDRNQEEADTRLAVDALVRDLRQAYTGAPATMGAVKFPASTSTSITLYSPDRAADFHLRQIVYTMAAGVLTRAVTTSVEGSLAVGTSGGWTFTGQPVSSAPVLTGITNASLFTYLDQNNAPTVLSSSLQAVQIDLSIDLTPASSPTPEIFQTRVDLRVTI
jgi:hypothetical protein